MVKLLWARQFVSFGAIGIIATATHVVIAWFSYSSGGVHPGLANLLGAVTAFIISFYGNRSLTFKSNRAVSESVWRYMIISLVSYLFATAIMLTIERYRLPPYLFIFFVIIAVPPITFVLAKSWAFSEAFKNSSKGEAKECK